MILSGSDFNISYSSKLTVALANGHGWLFDQINHIRELHKIFFFLSWFDLYMSWSKQNCLENLSMLEGCNSSAVALEKYGLGGLICSWINYDMFFVFPKILHFLKRELVNILIYPLVLLIFLSSKCFLIFSILSTSVVNISFIKVFFPFLYDIMMQRNRAVIFSGLSLKFVVLLGEGR